MTGGHNWTSLRRAGSVSAVSHAKDRSSSKRTPPVDVEQLGYEQAIEELETLIDRIESGDLTLDDAVAAYERGLALQKRCQAILDSAQQRLMRLSADGSETPAGDGAPASTRDGADEH